jgi:ribosomal protein S18 acetylase RimI-like enzyme
MAHHAPARVGGDGRALELGRLYLREEAKGLGARLLSHGLAQAEAAGYEVLWLLVWGRNERAIRFYRAWGFTEGARLSSSPSVVRRRSSA